MCVLRACVLRALSHPTLSLTLLALSPYSLSHPTLSLTLLSLSPYSLSHPTLSLTLLSLSPYSLSHPTLSPTLLMSAPRALSLMRSLLCLVAGFFFGLRAVLAGGLLLSVLLLFVRLGTELNHLRNHYLNREIYAYVTVLDDGGTLHAPTSRVTTYACLIHTSYL
jgi:hypothetical protein